MPKPSRDKPASKGRPEEVQQYIAAGRELLQVGKLASNGGVYVGRFDIGPNKHDIVSCNLFALPQILKDVVFGIFCFDTTVTKVAQLKIIGRDTLQAPSATYKASLVQYLLTHVRRHPGNTDAQSSVFIPWAAPLKSMVRSAHAGSTEFVLPATSPSNHGDLLLSCESEPGNPNGRAVISAQTGGTDYYPRQHGKFGCVLFFATPALG